MTQPLRIFRPAACGISAETQISAVSGSAADAVVLLHGLFATHRSMQIAQRRLECEGYLVINWGYRTFWRSVEQHAQVLLPQLQELEASHEIRSINFLTHSMGAILARYTIELAQFAKLGRMVMLAPPNAGSHLTKISLGPFARVLPAIGELSHRPGSLLSRLSEPRNIEVGVIAASSDFVVRVANTFLSCQRDHCIVKSNHFELPRHDGALTRSLSFLAHGMFNPPATINAIPLTTRAAA